MKVAIVTPVFPPYYAGIGRVAEQEAEGLAKLGYEVTVLTPFYDLCKKGDLKSSDERLSARGGSPPDGRAGAFGGKDYKIKRLKPLLKFGNAAWLPQLGKEIKGFDIIHLHYPFIGAIDSILKSKILNHKSKIIITYHMELVGRGWKGLFFKLYTRLTLPKVIKVADKIIVSSLDYARHGDLAPYLEREPKKFVEIPFGVATICHSERSEESLSSHLRDPSSPCLGMAPQDDIKDELGIKEGEKVILFVGGLDKAHYFKGVDILLKAFKKLIFNLQSSIFKLLIVGDGDLRPYYEKQAQKLGIANRVIFAGRVRPEDLPTYYQAADVFVLPSTTRSEAYGLVLLEAMSHGVPVIASELPGVRTNVSSERGILVKSGDVKNLSEALLEILGDDVKRKEMGERARQWVEEERSLDKEMRELDKTITAVVR